MDTQKANWSEYRGAATRGKYAKYTNAFVVIITKAGELLLSRKAFEALGKPTYIKTWSDFDLNLIALTAADRPGIGVYKAQVPANKDNVTRLSAKGFIEDNKLTRNKTLVYRAYTGDVNGYNGIIVSYATQTPSQL
jgi:hypothetical protein